MSTTMERIRRRLARLGWVPELDAVQQNEVAVAAADVGDGRAADELAAIAASWRSLAGALERQDRRIGRTYGKVAQDLEDRVKVLRAAGQLRKLLAARHDLGVAPETVAVESLTCAHDLVLTTAGLRPVNAVLAAIGWCAVLSCVQADLVAGPPKGEHHLLVTGMFLDCCSTRVDAGLPAADPDADVLLGRWLPPAGQHVRVTPAWLAQLTSTINGSELVASPAPRECAAPTVLGGTRPASSN